MTAARPRLLRLARSQGLSPGTADDVVQETLLEAWRHLDDLYAPGGFDAWLTAICLNVCRRHARADGLLARRQARLPDPYLFEEWAGTEDVDQPDIPDPLAFDPAEEVDRQDLQALLDRALGYLPGSAREAVELCYLAELPQREAALRLGLTIGSLEARLHRARKQLRQVLSGALRAEAQAFGLALDDGAAAGWRETRLWCTACGRRRMHGAFEPLPGDRVNLHLRCPDCSRELNTRGLVPLNGMRSFRPAYRRWIQYVAAYLTQGVARGWQPCPFCGTEQRVRIARPDELGDLRGQWSGLKAVMLCAACGGHADPGVAPAVWSHPAARRFMAQHPRWITEPETRVDHEGRPAIRIRLTDVASAARLTLLADSQTLEVLTTFQS